MDELKIYSPFITEKNKTYSNWSEVFKDGAILISKIDNRPIFIYLMKDCEQWICNVKFFIKSKRIKDDLNFSTPLFLVLKKKPKSVIDMPFSKGEDTEFDCLEELKKIMNEKMSILRSIKEISESTKNKKVPVIIGLIKPIRWEEIKLFYDGYIVKIKQNNTLLGEYSLESLGVPKIRQKTGGLLHFFMALFISDLPENSKVLSSRSSINQKRKSILSKILKTAFETNKDPIYKVDHIYKPLFNTKLTGVLEIHEHPLGRKLRDEDGASWVNLSDDN